MIMTLADFRSGRNAHLRLSCLGATLTRVYILGRPYVLWCEGDDDQILRHWPYDHSETNPELVCGSHFKILLSYPTS